MRGHRRTRDRAPPAGSLPRVRRTLPRARSSWSASCRWRATSRCATRTPTSRFDDLLQVASLGLIKAIDRFEPGRGTKFTSYAAPTILGELKRHFRDKGWSLHVPRDLQERTLAVSRATEILSKELGRSPKVREVAGHLGCSVGAGARGAGGRGELRGGVARRAGRARRRRVRVARGPARRARTRPTSWSRTAQAIASTWLALPEVERQVLELRFMHDLTQREIGERIGYSQMHVSRLLRRALTRLETAAAAA